MSRRRGKIVLIDDQDHFREVLKDFLTQENYQVLAYSSGQEALEALSWGGNFDLNDSHHHVDAVILDVNASNFKELEITPKILHLQPEVPILLLTTHCSAETAVEAMRQGAFNYVLKPYKLPEIIIHLDRAMERRKLKNDNDALRTALKKFWSMNGMIGKSKALRSVFDLIARVTDSTANVLITGESGTGKELVARAIHEKGPRSDKPFVAVNCSAIPETLLESELFGHAKGSFTGATHEKRGLFVEANGGTLFLDEIGDMEISLQAKLLRVVQDKKIRPVGENAPIPIDVRIITATHKDLKVAMKHEEFREDLFYRLSVIPIVIPPLRDRKEDIPLLAEHFLNKFVATSHSPIKGFAPAAMAQLTRMNWEGNVRELENLIERLVVLCLHDVIDVVDLPAPQETQGTDQVYNELTEGTPSIQDLEKRYIKYVLQKTGNQKDKAAHILGINRRTLYRKVREYGFVKDSTDTPPPSL